jgi:hypothetical protein
MHIVVSREDVSKYGLQGLVDANVNESVSLDSLMALLGHGPVIRPGVGAPPYHPISVLWVETLQLRARLEAVMMKMPKATRKAPLQRLEEIMEALGEVACYLTTALSWELDRQAREAAGLAPEGEDTEPARQAGDETAGQAMRQQRPQETAAA